MTSSLSGDPASKNSSDGSWTIQRVLAWSVDFLRERGVERCRLDVEQMLAAVLGLQRIDLYTKFDRPLTVEERGRFKGWLVRRARGEPLSYILGYRDFCGHRFIVSGDTLIPRPDTEVLVERAVDHINAANGAVTRVLDIGTGSGCIAISLAKAFPKIEFYAVDISKQALDVASQNIEVHGIANVNLMLADMGSPSFWQALPQMDLIVSNPPYIGEEERPELPQAVVGYEPHLALFAANAGLYYYELLTAQSHRILKENGYLFVEVGYRQGTLVADLFKKAEWQGVAIYPDYSGTPRVVCGSRPSV